MPDGNMRRPKQLPEQILARKTAILGVGISAGDVTSIVDPTPTPGTDGGVEAPVLTPSPSDFIAPSTPTLSGTVQGIRVSWDGKNANGDPYPAGAFVEIHISTSGATFTPSSSTLAGRLLGSAGFFTIGALAAGTTYYVRLVGVDEAGNTTSPSTAASSQTGLTTTNDYGTGTITSGAVSFNARSIGGITTTVGTTAPSSPVTGDIWLDSTGGAITHKRWNGSSWVTQAWGSSSLSANCITATQIAAGAVTAGAILAGEVTAEKIKGDAIDGKTITGATFRTSATAGTGTVPRAGIVISTSGLFGYDASGNQTISINASTGAVTIAGNAATSLITGSQVNSNVTAISGGAITTGTINAARIDSAILRATDVGSGGSTTIDGGRITTGTVSASRIDVANLVAEKVTSGPFSSRRVVIGEFGATDAVQFKGASTSNGWLLAHNAGNSNLSLSSTYGTVTFEIYEDVAITGGISASAATVDFQGVYDNNTTGLAPVGITTTGRLRRNGTSSQTIKYDIATLSGELSASVDQARQCDVATTDPTAILDVAVVEFSVIDEGLPTERRLLGFIADDVADKLPIAVLQDADGQPAGVIDQAMVAALLAVVKDQQTQIADLTTRLEALEA